MAAAHAKASGNSCSQDTKGKEKRKKCTNCKKSGHLKEDCFQKGRGKADNPPDWWKEKVTKAKEKGNKSVNAANKESDDKDNNNYAIVAINVENEIDKDIPNIALIITSGHDHNAHAALKSTGVIIDCGASSHFSPDKAIFIDYHEIPPEPVKAADGHTFSAIGKGNLKVNLPTCSGHKPMMVTLQGVYYTPNMAFTLISVSCLDHTGCSVLIKDNTCVICGT